ncbi:diguanylate cyclase (GGDEF) domain-containing protein [Shewanella psychrophila]|uniref:diguanylate cyclase n=1 Tax=Shewanella psychrophila TaxID=225848 RepID=A0A1S6HL86_9GAMM|nr:GGDEF domain-containing protein [Shewanella psychrophila]AQS36296.1 diguanylate cyclase (GGDEF) domain-containing protein [Shewanella psychrophila]
MNLAKHLSDTELSAKILRHAVPKMSELNIPVTPVNYAVWYEYYLGINLDLKRAIDGLISNGITFCTEVNDGLHKNFIQEKSPEVIENVQIETQIIINSLFSKVSKLTQGTARLSDTLSDFSQELKQQPDVEVLNTLVNSLVDNIEGVILSNKQMEGSLNTMRDEVSSLKIEMESLNLVAMTDQLTSLNNRRSFEDEVMKHMQEFIQTQSPSCLLLIDIDHFKQFNDTHGHLVGDKVLAYVALALKQAVKGTDFVARYGGEEFVILLPNTELTNALVVAEQLRKVIAERKLTIGKDKKLSLGSITVSLGVSALTLSDDRESYFVRADEALYRAKSTGRNRVCSE